MKTIQKLVFITTLLMLFQNTCEAQNLTVDQVLSLRTKSLSHVDEYLTTKKWEMISANEPSEDKMGTLSFAYNKSNYDDKAESFLQYYYNNESTSRNRINIQVNKASNYNNYIIRIKSLGFKLQNSFVEDGDLVKVYEKNGITIKINTSTQKDDFSSTKTTYSFFVLSTSSYYNLYDQ